MLIDWIVAAFIEVGFNNFSYHVLKCQDRVVCTLIYKKKDRLSSLMEADLLKAEKKYKNKIKLVKIDYDKNVDLCKDLQIKQIPTLVILPKVGKYDNYISECCIGYCNYNQICSKIDKAMEEVHIFSVFEYRRMEIDKHER